MSSTLVATKTPQVASSDSAAVYDGIYVRNNLGCNGTVPSPGPYNLSPDIIQSLAPVSDPQSVYSTPASWAQTYATEPAYGQKNYYYVRGLNGAEEAESSEVSLFYAPAQLILFPGTWKNNPIPAANGSENVSIAAGPGSIAVGADSFVWANPPAPGAGSSFYSLVAQIHDQEDPDPIPVVSSWLDMAQILGQELGFGFRNSCYLDNSVPAWTERLMLNIPSSIPDSGQVMLSISATGLTGATIGLIADSFLPNQQPILLQPVKVTQNVFVTALQVTLPPGFSASIAVQCWNPGNQAPAPGSSVTIGAAYMVPQQQYAEATQRSVIDSRLSHFLSSSAGIGPTPMASLGSASFVLNAPPSL